MNPSLATIANELHQRIDQLFQRTTRYLPEDHSELLAFKDEANKLSNSDPVQRSLILARLYALSGNTEQVDYYIRNARNLKGDEIDLDLARLTTEMVSGKFESSLEIIKKWSKPDNPNLSIFIHQRPMLPAFQNFVRIHNLCTELGTSEESETPKSILDAASIMEEWDDSDEDYARAFDFAGNVLRNKKLLLAPPGIGIEISQHPYSEDPRKLKLTLHVDVDEDEALDMTCEYMELLAYSKTKIPNSLILEFTPLP